MSQNIAVPFSSLEQSQTIHEKEILIAKGDKLERISVVNFAAEFQLISKIAVPIHPDNPAPTIIGFYKPQIYSDDPGTNYPNIGNLKAVNGFETLFYFDGNIWIGIANEIKTRSIANIQKTITVGLVDTYTIAFTDGNTFNYEVTNGRTKIVSQSLMSPIIVSNITKKVNFSDFLFFDFGSFAFSGEIDLTAIPDGRFIKIYIDLADNAVKWVYHNEDIGNSILLMTLNCVSAGISIENILFSASNTVIIDGYSYQDFPNLKIVDSKIKNLESKRDSILLQPEDIFITYTDAVKKIKINLPDNYLFLQGFSTESTIPTLEIINQTVEFDITSDFMRLMYDLVSKTFVFKRYNLFTNFELTSYVNIGLWNFPNVNDNRLYGYLQNGKSYKLNTNITLRGDGEVFVFENTIKFGQIGDSITEIGDNKVGDSYTAVGYGYGRRICEAMKIPFENHFPNGRNGRSSADYIDEWNAGTIAFPDNLDLVTIFLGTNDWGTQALELGTQDDYLNDTYTTSNRTTYGAFRKIINKLRNQNTKQIILISPMLRGAFGHTGGNYMKSAIIKNGSGQWEYTANILGITLKQIYDAVKWISEYENLDFIDAFNGLVDKNLLNISVSSSGQFNPDGTIKVYQDLLYDNLHPSFKGFKKLTAKVLDVVKANFL